MGISCSTGCCALCKALITMVSANLVERDCGELLFFNNKALKTHCAIPVSNELVNMVSVEQLKNFIFHKSTFWINSHPSGGQTWPQKVRTLIFPIRNCLMTICLIVFNKNDFSVLRLQLVSDDSSGQKVSAG